MVSLSRDLGFGVVAKVEGETYTDCFKQLAMIEECYDNIPKNVEWFRHRVREVDDNEFFELVGQTNDFKVRPRLSLGQYKSPKGFLFPKRKASEAKGGAWLENNGWVVWKKEEDSTTSATTNEKPASTSKRGKKQVDEDTDF